jgi:putative tricarboxylic transport membrane protein
VEAVARRNNADLISGAVLAGLGLYIVVEARGWDYLTPEGPGPGFFPLWYGAALVALSLVLMASSITRRLRDAGKRVVWPEVARALTVWVGLAVSIALLKVLGFLLSFALLTFFIVSPMYRRPVVHGLAAGVVGAAVFYVLFALALNVSLPVGVLGF